MRVFMPWRKARIFGGVGVASSLMQATRGISETILDISATLMCTAVDAG